MWTIWSEARGVDVDCFLRFLVVEVSQIVF